MQSIGYTNCATKDNYFDNRLFSLTAGKGKKDLETLESASDKDDNLGDSESEAAAESCDLDSDAEHRRYDEQVEETHDEDYERYLIRSERSTKQRKRAKQDLSIGGTELIENADADDVAMDPDFYQDLDGKEVNPFIIPLNEDDPPTQEQIMEQWFGQDVFAAAAEDGVLEESNGEAEVVPSKFSKKSENMNIRPKDPSALLFQKAKQQEDFDMVLDECMDSTDDSSVDKESEEQNDDANVEILAYWKMLRRKQRDQIIDEAYNKYMYDGVDLIKWFLEDEKGTAD